MGAWMNGSSYLQQTQAEHSRAWHCCDAALIDVVVVLTAISGHAWYGTIYVIQAILNPDLLLIRTDYDGLEHD